MFTQPSRAAPQEWMNSQSWWLSSLCHLVILQLRVSCTSTQWSPAMGHWPWGGCWPFSCTLQAISGQEGLRRLRVCKPNKCSLSLLFLPLRGHPFSLHGRVGSLWSTPYTVRWGDFTGQGTDLLGPGLREPPPILHSFLNSHYSGNSGHCCGGGLLGHGDHPLWL